MADAYKILYEGASAEIVEKKSRFIADVAPVTSEEEAAAFIDGIKKKYWDCKHHCTAFVIGPRAELTRCSDDGEPSGTAGRPILDLILGSGVRDICIVVSRYFGGTLLGTGGLVRAYSAAAKAGLEASDVRLRQPARQVSIGCSYDLLGKIQYITAEMGLTPVSTDYAEAVKMGFEVPSEFVDRLVSRVTEATAARAAVEVSEEEIYILTNV